MNLHFVRIIDTFLGIPLIYLLVFIRKVSGAWGRLKPERACRKILLIKFWGIGNIFMLLPAAGPLRRKYPEGRFDILTLRCNKTAAETASAFDDIHTIDTGSIFSFLRTSLANLIALKNRDYDLIMDFEQFARFSAIFSALTGKGKTIGFNTSGQHRHFLYSIAVPYDNTVHITQSFFSLAACAGADCPDSPAAAPVIRESAGSSFALPGNLAVSPEDIIVIVHPGTSINFKERRWPEENYARLSDLLIDKFGVRVFFTGLAEEAHLVRKAIDCMKNKARVLDLSGRLEFRAFFSLIRAADLVISADTAPVHLASAAGVPVTGIYGPNTPLLYGPWGRGALFFYKGLPCSPCITNFNGKIHTCRHENGRGACMRSISVEEVFEGIRDCYFAPEAPYRLKKINKDVKCAVF